MENISSITASSNNESRIPDQRNHRAGGSVPYFWYQPLPTGSPRSQRYIYDPADSSDIARARPQKRMPLSSIRHSAIDISPQDQRTQYQPKEGLRTIRNRRGRVGRVSNARKDDQDLSPPSNSGFHSSSSSCQSGSPGVLSSIDEAPQAEALYPNHRQVFTSSSQSIYPEDACGTALSSQLVDARVLSDNLHDQPSPHSSGLNTNLLEFPINQDARARLYPCKQLSGYKHESLIIPSSA